MGKNIKIIGLAVLVTLGVFASLSPSWANDSSTPQRRYYQQVPHIVLPQTIEYHPTAKTSTTGRIAPGGYRNYHPATYTAYPSYESDEALKFRTINQVSYPVTPESPAWTTPEQAAEYWQQHQVQVQKPAWVKEPEEETPPTPEPLPQLQPTIPTNVNPNPNRGSMESEFQNHSTSEKKWTSSPQSLVFVKSQRENLDFDGEKPTQLLKSSVAKGMANPVWDTDWWMNAGDFELAMQVSYNQPATPAANPAGAALTSQVPDYSAILQQFQMQQVQPQQAQVAPTYAGGCLTYGNGPCMGAGTQRYGCGQNRFCNKQPNYGCYTNYAVPGYYCHPSCCCPAPEPVYSPQVIQDAWNTYFKAYSSQQSAITPVSGMTGMPQPCPMPQPGMGNLPNYGYMAFNPAANAMQQQMVRQMQQQTPSQTPQTVGYIVLYPNQNQEDETDENAESDDPRKNMKAVFVPFDSQQGMSIQAAMGAQMQQGMMNPCMNPMMGGMNPWMNPYANPMAMGMNPWMNPYMNPMCMGMMNPWMMGMGQPQIIIQMPQSQGRERKGGLFAKMRQQRAAAAANPTATASHAPVCNDGSYSQYRTPAKAAYPYGYFGAQTEPYKTGNFGGYGDTQFRTVTYPGF